MSVRRIVVANATSSANLILERNRVSLTGRIRMSRAKAQALIDAGHRVALRLPERDLPLSGLVATARGLEFRHRWPCLDSSALDEREPRVSVAVT